MRRPCGFNAFFDGSGAGLPALTLAVWVAIGIALSLLADRRGRHPATARGYHDTSTA